MPLPTFLTAAELKTHIYEGTVNAISDGDDTLMPQAIAAAVQEAAGYMSRFDYVTVLEQTDVNRDPILLQYIKEMAVWHFIGLANANINYDVALDRYSKAIKWLDKVADGRFLPVGWPIALVPAVNSFFQVDSSVPKRRNHY
jgi:phage gp36-like protein